MSTADLLMALVAAAQHRHSWTWGESKTNVDGPPPPEVTCACGKTYADVLAERKG